jgi:hypothetical protein
MPDGTGLQRDATAFGAMHTLLLDWGAFLRGGGAIVDAARLHTVRADNKEVGEAACHKLSTKYRERDPSYNRRDWTQPEIDLAGLLHNRVIALPIQRSLVLQTFYFQEDAKYWDDLPTAEQWQRILDLTHWAGRPQGVNPRIDEHNQQLRQRYGEVVIVPPIVPEAFMSIRHRAIRELIARERGMVAT